MHSPWPFNWNPCRLLLTLFSCFVLISVFLNSVPFKITRPIRVHISKCIYKVHYKSILISCSLKVVTGYCYLSMRGCWGINSKLLLKGWLLKTGLQGLALNLFNHMLNISPHWQRHRPGTAPRQHEGSAQPAATASGRAQPTFYCDCSRGTISLPEPRRSLCLSNLKSDSANKRQSNMGSKLQTGLNDEIRVWHRSRS